LSQGKTIPEACRKIGVTEQTYYRWRKEYGGVQTDEAKRLKERDWENARLKKLLAEAKLDKAILREAASENFYLDHSLSVSEFELVLSSRGLVGGTIRCPTVVSLCGAV
jgi:transposase-like protein